MQRTIKSKVKLRGYAQNGGELSELILHPAPSNHGIKFRLGRGSSKEIEALWYNARIDSSSLCLSNSNGESIFGVEHLLSACYGMGIDNLIIEVKGRQLPYLDGSSAEFSFMLECGGSAIYKEERRLIELGEEMRVSHNQACGIFLPASGLQIDYMSDVDENKDVRRQFLLGKHSYKTDLSRSRHLSATQSSHNRFSDEAIRHHILDSLGILCLCGSYLRARILLNSLPYFIMLKFIRELFSSSNKYRLVKGDGFLLSNQLA